LKRRIAAFFGIQCCAALAAGAADRAHTLNVYAWPDYFPPPLIAKFQAETGIHINYPVFDDPAMAETTLSVGSSGYDIVTMNASPELGREIPKGFWLKLDQARIPKPRNADPKIMQLLQAVDPGNRYAVPWMWGTTGLIYNTDKINAIIARRMAQDGHTSVHLAYSFARESVPFWIDNLVIPADSPNPDGALAFINFVMRPEMSAEVTRFIGFATGNAAAMPLLEPAVRDNVIIYPPASVRERFALEKVYTPEEMRTFVRAWQRFKAAD